MKHLPRRCWLCLIPLLITFSAPAAERPIAVTPASLRCEYLQNPLGINETAPRLTWILTSSGDAIARGISQKSYHILVASTSELLAQDKGDLWDSGDVASADSSNIPYAGSPLHSRQACYWKVRTVDSNGRQSAWSKPAMWELGLLNPGDWSAQWLDAPMSTPPAAGHGPVSIISATYQSQDGSGSKDVTKILKGLLKDASQTVAVTSVVFKGDPAPNHVKQLHVTYVMDGGTTTATAAEGTTLTIPAAKQSLSLLREDFTLGKPIAKARIYATALGLYELHLNGARVGDHILAPDWTDYNKRVRYQDYDVTSLVKQGANTVAGMVAPGWYAGTIGNGGYQAWGKVPALYAQLEVTYKDGSTDTFATDATWKIHPSPIVSSDFMLGETYDARAEIQGWDRPGLDTSSWQHATVRDEPARSIDGQVDQPVRETGELPPKSVSQPAPGHWVYDLGQNMVGVVRLKISAPAGTAITLRHAEMLNKDGTIYTANLRGAPSIDTYICKGDGVETWQPRFTFHGFRYVELTGAPRPPGRNAVTGIVIGTDIPRTGQFTCSDPAINQLQSNIQWGMRGNYLSVPTDCPQRNERMGWMGDAEVFIRTATYNGDVAAFFTKWLVDVDDAQTPDGAYTDVSPSPHGAGHGNPGVPAWADAGVICPWTIYQMYGDTRILQQHLPAMMKWIEWCRTHSTDLIRDKDRGPDYGDWLSQGENTPKEVIGTAYFAYSTSLLAKACRAVGDTANAEKYEALAGEIKDAFNKKYVTPDGRILGNTQSDYAMALRFDLLPDNLRPKAGQYLADDIASHGNHLTTGFVGVSLLLPALCKENQLTTAYNLFEQDTFPSWLFSVKQGATTIWERWDGWTPNRGFQNPGMNSFNHYSLGSCGEWMFDTVAGIGLDAEHPGFSHIIIQPRPGGTLTHAAASYDSIHGKIATDWSLENGKFSLKVTIPLNATATVVLPGGEPPVQVGSGSYAFSGKGPG
jgi:alpha-L-rhamnosidase